MHTDIIYRLLWLFFLYSFIGWVLETAAAAVGKKRFVNRGVLNGPVCCIYGFTALVLTAGTRELTESWFFLFLGCMILATFIEWTVGRILEKLHHHRWWDYSDKKWNIDGYICLRYSVLWGILGALALKYASPFFMQIYQMIPLSVVKIILWVMVVLLVIDGIGSYGAIFHMTRKMPDLESVKNRIGAASLRLAERITTYVENRMTKAHPTLAKEEIKISKPQVFAEGCSFYKLAALFFIGAFLGDITETIFCRITAGVWMSRSSVVWGPFSIVWGLAIVFATLILYNYRERSDGFLFWFGTILGGAYEYVCSVFTEIFFGTVFWDYSEIPFNLGGRINLLYCFFWGIAAVVWLKKIYPPISGYIEKIPMSTGKIISWVLIGFMTVNIVVSALALTRYSERQNGQTADAYWEQVIDTYYGNEKMERIYPNAIPTE